MVTMRLSKLIELHDQQEAIIDEEIDTKSNIAQRVALDPSYYYREINPPT